MRSALRGVFREGHCIIDREIRGIQHRVQDRLEGITDSEYESLIDIALGLTDKTIATRRGLSIRGAQSRIKHLYDKLGLVAGGGRRGRQRPVFNSRTRAIYLAHGARPDQRRRAAPRAGPPRCLARRSAAPHDR